MQNICKLLNTTEQDIQAVLEDKSRYYVSYPIVKRSGKKRWINSPQEPLKTWQKIILRRILDKFNSHHIAHGFVKRKSPATNAKCHVGKRILVTVDIQDFFGSITIQQVFDTFNYINKKKAYNFSEAELQTLTDLVTYREALPQGAPTSPTLANFVCIPADSRLVKCGHFDVITRYADDIAVSSDSKDFNPVRAINIIKFIYQRVLNLKINPRKIHIRRNNKRMQVTGIVVNKRLNVEKNKARKLRAELHQLVANKVSITPIYQQQLQGKIAWISALNPKKGAKLAMTLSQISVSNA